MSNLQHESRTASLPIDHLIAEMTAFPLAGEAAFQAAVTDLGFAGNPRESSLWRVAERDFVHSSPSLSIDEIVLLRDRIWYASTDDSRSVPLHRYLRHIAAQNLELAGPVALPRVAECHTAGAAESVSRQVRSRLAWRWMSFALPPDLLLAAAWTPGRRPTQIQLLTPAMSRHLEEQGFAESHLHIGAALRFPLLWSATLYRLAEHDLKESTFAAHGAIFDEGKRWSDWLLRAGITRYFLAAFLAQKGIAGGARRLANYMTQVAGSELAKQMQITTRVVLESAIQELRQGALAAGPALSEVQSAYRELTRILDQPFPDDLERTYDGDPIACFFRPIPALDLSADTLFTAAGLQYLDELDAGSRGKDPLFATLFWQVIRIRTMYTIATSCNAR